MAGIITNPKVTLTLKMKLSTQMIQMVTTREKTRQARENTFQPLITLKLKDPYTFISDKFSA